jgi:TPR repeat protein
VPEALVDLAVMQSTGEGRPVQEAYGRTNILTTASSRGSKYLLYRMYDKGLHSFEKDPVKAMQYLQAAAAGEPSAITELAAKSVDNK